MKLISLNLWGGRLYGPLEKFLKEQSKEVDIFCFQEIYNEAVSSMSDEPRVPRFNLLADLQQLLPDHKAYFHPVINNVYGIGIFVKKDLQVLEEGEIDIHKVPEYSGHGGNHSRNLEWVNVKAHGKVYSILNVHGLWTGTGKGKKDTPERIAQSQKIRQFMSVMSNPKVLCGDFNLRPDTESMKMLELDMINLVKKYEIKSTRSEYYPKEERFADYILVSHDVDVRAFRVLQEPVSDHLPLFLEFA